MSFSKARRRRESREKRERMRKLGLIGRLKKERMKIGRNSVETMKEKR